MHTYVSLLRGINVSGQKKITMSDLTAIYRKAGLKDVQTYIQSGNVIFKSDLTDPPALSKLMEKAILNSTRFQVVVIIRTPEDLAGIIRSNPFMKDKQIDERRLHVTFLSEIPEPAGRSNIDLPLKSGRDKFHASGREIYIYCPGGYGKTKLSNTYFEKKLGIPATTRNWRTVNTLLRMTTPG